MTRFVVTGCARSGTSYTARLLAQGLPRVAQKVGEEAVETVIAALAGGVRDGAPAASEGPSSASAPPLVSEAADLLFHLLVLLHASGADPLAVTRELARRHRERAAAAGANEASRSGGPR